jgi:hypothetical protein
MNKMIEFGKGSYYISLDRETAVKPFVISMGEYGDEQMTISIEADRDDLLEILGEFTKMVKDA